MLFDIALFIFFTLFALAAFGVWAAPGILMGIVATAVAILILVGK